MVKERVCEIFGIDSEIYYMLLDCIIYFLFENLINRSQRNILKSDNKNFWNFVTQGLIDQLVQTMYCQVVYGQRNISKFFSPAFS